MTDQKLYDKVMKHAAAGIPSRNEKKHACWYRGPEGQRCFVGVLISDEQYVPEMEGKFVDELNFPGMPWKPDQLPLLLSLQYVHDNLPLHLWSSALRKVAEKHNLRPHILTYERK